MANPLKSLQCSIRYDNARVLSWTMEPGYNYPEDFILEVENCRPGGPWTVLSDNLKDSDTCTYIDTRRRNYNKAMLESYRLKLRVMDGTTVKEQYVTDAVDAGIQNCYPFSSEAKNATVQIAEAIKQSGVEGVLLKRKVWGERCPDCTDFNGQMSVNEHCPTCFGTGIKGGYYNGISLNLIKDQIQNREGVNQYGLGQSQNIQARCIAYPYITTGDVWVETGTNYRYAISAAVATSIYKTVPIVYTLTLKRLEYTDAMYNSQIDDKVNLKDVWDSSKVDYTPTYVSNRESVAKSAWEQALDSL